MKYGITISNNFKDIDDTNKIAGNLEWDTAFNLEYSKLVDILIFWKMMNIERKSDLFQYFFCTLFSKLSMIDSIKYSV